MPNELEKLIRDYSLKQIALSRGSVMDEDTPLQDVVTLMREQNTGCVVTSKEEKVTGIFTERDFLRRVIGQKKDWTRPIREFSTRSPITMKAGEPLRKALYLMRKKEIRHIPIFEEDETLKGILSIRNVIQFLAEHFPAEVINLPPRLTAFPKTVDGG